MRSIYAPAAERRMIMDEVKNYPPYLDYPKPHKEQTNADRIRSMTDRELADFFYGIRECSVCAYNYEDRCVRCSDGIFKWLQKPAETPKEDA